MRRVLMGAFLCSPLLLTACSAASNSVPNVAPTMVAPSCVLSSNTGVMMTIPSNNSVIPSAGQWLALGLTSPSPVPGLFASHYPVILTARNGESVNVDLPNINFSPINPVWMGVMPPLKAGTTYRVTNGITGLSGELLGCFATSA